MDVVFVVSRDQKNAVDHDPQAPSVRSVSCLGWTNRAGFGPTAAGCVCSSNVAHTQLRARTRMNSKGVLNVVSAGLRCYLQAHMKATTALKLHCHRGT